LSLVVSDAGTGVFYSGADGSKRCSLYFEICRAWCETRDLLGTLISLETMSSPKTFITKDTTTYWELLRGSLSSATKASTHTIREESDSGDNTKRVFKNCFSKWVCARAEGSGGIRRAGCTHVFRAPSQVPAGGLSSSSTSGFRQSSASPGQAPSLRSTWAP